MTVTETKPVKNLYSYLKHTTADEIIIRTSLCRGGWHDNEFDAQMAGFTICRFQNPEYIARHEFAECYRLVRNSKMHNK